MSDEYTKGAADDMAKTLDQLKRDLLGVRTGRATPSLIEHLPVEVQSYGSTMHLKELGGITAPDARLLMVNPWDKGTIKDIERAIAVSGLGFNPQSDGQVIRIPIPALTGERRQQLVKIVKQHLEDAKVRVRQVRRDYNEMLKTACDDGDLTDDQLTKALEKVQKSTDEFCKKVDEMGAAKEKEILEV
ncbi:MAG: ribosome recycling factor [Deltaproteobacteria bacterium]|nr:ribosome recycling factor [Deltaproteobacteria bacterium]